LILEVLLAFYAAARGVHQGENFFQEIKKDLAEWLVQQGRVPGVLCAHEAGTALWFHSQGCWQLPDEKLRRLSSRPAVSRFAA